MPLNIDYLDDDVFHDITTTGHDGISTTTCDLSQINPFEVDDVYECKFTATVNGQSGETHTDTVTACDTSWEPEPGVCDDDDATVDIVGPETGTIVIVKQADPADDTAFDYTDNIAAPNAFTLQVPSDTTETFNEVTPGTYTVTEASESGWKLTGLSCDDGNSTVNLGSRQATIRVEAGKTVTCTFQNIKPLNLVSLCQLTPETRRWRVDNPNNAPVNYQVQLQTTTDATPNRVAPPGQSTFETVDGGGANTTKIVWTDSFGHENQVTKASQNTMCKGTIVIVKSATPADDTSFGFTDDIAAPNNFSLQDPSDDTKTFTNVDVGSYTVTETGAAGWELASVSCNDQDSTGDVQQGTASIMLQQDETVTCTFVNRQSGGGGFCPAENEDVGLSMTELLGIGQGSTTKGFRTRKIVIPNYQNLESLYGQLAAVDEGVDEVRALPAAGPSEDSDLRAHKHGLPAVCRRLVGHESTDRLFVREGSVLLGQEGQQGPARVRPLADLQDDGRIRQCIHHVRREQRKPRLLGTELVQRADSDD